MLLGFIPEDLQLSAFTKNQHGYLQASSNGKAYRKCKNNLEHNVCNWMIQYDDSHEYCVSCRLNQVIPNLQTEGNDGLWLHMEQAKRRLLYTLFKLNLPISNLIDNPDSGLGFSFLEDQTEDEFGNELTIKEFVTTGHSAGLITIKLSEAEPTERLKMREKMKEQYRTLVGHFRHESGHYYWDRLINNSPHIDKFRELFGDERLDYKHAMQIYYDNGPTANWQKVWVSAYASMHPWEDWAETWAHYLHMVDTLETANDCNMSIDGKPLANPLQLHNPDDFDYRITSFTHLFDDWCALTDTLNRLNRSMGLDEAYPFVFSIVALDKLRFVHDIVLDQYK